MTSWKLDNVYDVNLLLRHLKVPDREIPDMIRSARNTEGFIQVGLIGLKHISDDNWEAEKTPIITRRQFLTLDFCAEVK